MARIKGITITLYNRTQTGEDALKHPIYEETAEEVENVLVGEPTTEEITNTLTLTGKQGRYWLGIPKGDTNEWENRKVSFFGQTFQTIGFVIQGIEENIPLDWNKKIMVARYE